ncbi:hypothetical protein OJ997_31035 [Solirubrobacter phytolaccae]|uniref:Uncharacterized protein n=1 Tax=Solirubrobacter phytolaccae TaxID=1404360 RepID=A0A9X3NE33_9ACTN|nr:hypothetical protein [Solirubrobacter phytolaccae]MDA0184778.1 hypothetical protein [Solirubrobacter phytolaccae]
MKKLLAVVLAGCAFGPMAGSAIAADLQTCRSESSTSSAPDYKRVGREVRKAIVPEAKKYLGTQYTAQWLQPDDAGWYVGVAPGKRSLAEVRAWLAGRVAKHFKGRDAKLIRSRMHVIRQPYGNAELGETGNAIWELLSQEGPFISWDGGEGCTLSNAYRTEIFLYEDSTEADLEEVRRKVAEFGDRVRVTRLDEPMANG